MDYTDKIIDGKLHAKIILQNLEQEIVALKAALNIFPKLVVIIVGNDPASVVYVRNKAAAAKEIGMISQVISLPFLITQQQLLDVIDELNHDVSVHGIIVQMPLPEHISPLAVLSSIDPTKDVDGFHPLNVGLLQIGSDDGFVPCTPLGCFHLLKAYLGNIKGMNAVVVGRSQIVGRPVAALLLKESCTVTICHSNTQNLQTITQKADIVISAIGKPHALGADHFNDNATILDVGITRVDNNGKTKLVGDVDFVNVISKVKYITPVPGGVGPMTVVCLLSNTLKAAVGRF